MSVSRFAQQTKHRRQNLLVELAVCHGLDREAVLHDGTFSDDVLELHGGMRRTNRKHVAELVGRYREKLAITLSPGRAHLLSESFARFETLVKGESELYATIELLCFLSRCSGKAVRARVINKSQGTNLRDAAVDSALLIKGSDLLEWEQAFIASLATVSDSDGSESSGDDDASFPQREHLPPSTTPLLSLSSASPSFCFAARSRVDPSSGKHATNGEFECFLVDHVVAVLCSIDSPVVCEEKGNSALSVPSCMHLCNLAGNNVGRCSLHSEFKGWKNAMGSLLELCTMSRKLHWFHRVFSSSPSICRCLESLLGAIYRVFQRHKRFLSTKPRDVSLAGASLWLQPMIEEISVLFHIVTSLSARSCQNISHDCSGKACSHQIEISTRSVVDTVYFAWRDEAALWNQCSPLLGRVELLLGMFLVVFQTYCDMLDDFVYCGQLPSETGLHDAFFVSLDSSLPSGTLQYWKEAYSIVESQVPAFLQLPATPKRTTSIAHCVYLCGKSMTLLDNVVQNPCTRLKMCSARGLFEQCIAAWSIPFSSSGGDFMHEKSDKGANEVDDMLTLGIKLVRLCNHCKCESKLTRCPTPELASLPTVFARCLSVPIVSRLPLLSAHISDFLSVQCDLGLSLASLQEVFGVGQGPFLDSLGSMLFTALESLPHNEWSRLDGVTLLNMVELCNSATSMHHILGHIMVEVLPVDGACTDAISFLECVQIQYVPIWPMNLIVSETPVKQYLRIWRFLMTVKCARYHLVMCSPTRRHRHGKKKLDSPLHQFDLLRFQMQSMWIALEQAADGVLRGAMRHMQTMFEASDNSLAQTIVDVYREDHEAFVSELHDTLLLDDAAMMAVQACARVAVRAAAVWKECLALDVEAVAATMESAMPTMSEEWLHQVKTLTFAIQELNSSSFSSVLHVLEAYV